MKFLVDESTGTSVGACLLAAGHDVASVAEVMPQATDPDNNQPRTPRFDTITTSIYPYNHIRNG